ncbi:MAG: hypothetical protein ACOY9Y_08940 [Bacillota bacterium]
MHHEAIAGPEGWRYIDEEQIQIFSAGIKKIMGEVKAAGQQAKETADYYIL